MNNTIVRLSKNGVNTEPSRERNFPEGATATERGYSAKSAMPVTFRKSAPLERDDIAWPMRRRMEDGFKRPIDNKSDETLDTTPQDGLTSAFYTWCEMAGTISISRREERQNSGEAQLLNLLKKKTEQAEMSIKSKTNQQLIQGTVSSAAFVPGNSAKDLFPLGYFLPKNNSADPGAGGNVGNISRASYSWWRPRTAVLDSGTKDTGNDFAVAVTTWAGLKVALKRMYNYCSRGADGSGPNIVVANQETFEGYESALEANLRYYDTGMADMGFDNVKLKGAVMVWDELVPDVDSGTTALTTGSAFFLNTKFYKLVIDSQTDFITTPFIEPENQTAKTAKILFMGNGTLSNPRKCGVCYAISLSLTA